MILGPTLFRSTGEGGTETQGILLMTVAGSVNETALVSSVFGIRRIQTKNASLIFRLQSYNLH